MFFRKKSRVEYIRVCQKSETDASKNFKFVLRE